MAAWKSQVGKEYVIWKYCPLRLTHVGSLHVVVDDRVLNMNVNEPKADLNPERAPLPM